LDWKSEGAKVRFKIVDDRSSIKELEVFTTRPDTLFGATFMVISPEHELVTMLLKSESLKVESRKQQQCKRKKD
jgi:leucyl-tRNA synthetase